MRRRARGRCPRRRFAPLWRKYHLHVRPGVASTACGGRHFARASTTFALVVGMFRACNTIVKLEFGFGVRNRHLWAESATCRRAARLASRAGASRCLVMKSSRSDWRSRTRRPMWTTAISRLATKRSMERRDSRRYSAASLVVSRPLADGGVVCRCASMGRTPRRHPPRQAARSNTRRRSGQADRVVLPVLPATSHHDKSHGTSIG